MKKKYVFSNIRFDWQWIYVAIGIVVVILAYSKCKERAEWCGIFEKKVLVEYRVISKETEKDYMHTGYVVLKNMKTGELTTRTIDRTPEEFLLFKSLKINEIVKLEGEAKEMMTPEERGKLWKGDEPLCGTWAFVMGVGFLGFVLSLIGSADESLITMFTSGIVFFILGIILLIFV